MPETLERPEDWAGTARLRFYHYLRRRYRAGADDRPLSVDEVTKLTRDLERFVSKESLTAKDDERVAAVRKLLWVERNEPRS